MKRCAVWFMVLAVSFLVLQETGYSRKTKEERQIERNAYWSILKELYLAEYSVTVKDDFKRSQKHLQKTKEHLARLAMNQSGDLTMARDRLNQADQVTKKDDFLTLIRETRKHLITLGGPNILPVRSSDKIKSKALFEEYCAACHSVSERQKAALSNQLKTRPTPFEDPKYQEWISPLAHYAAALSGMEEAGMAPLMENVDVDLLWDIAFYTTALSSDSELKPSDQFIAFLENHSSSFPLSKLVVLSNEELREYLKSLNQSCGECRAEISFLRHNWTFRAGLERLDTSEARSVNQKEKRAMGLLLVAVIAVSGLFMYVLTRRGRVK